MIFQVHTPAFPLHKFVSHFIYYEGFDPVHSMDRFLPDGNTEFIISLLTIRNPSMTTKP